MLKKVADWWRGLSVLSKIDAVGLTAIVVLVLIIGMYGWIR